MQIKTVAFDVGHTLVRYNNPLNWKKLYIPALKQAAEKSRLILPESAFKEAALILSKYNTRENPREKEVSSAIIFEEILNAWGGSSNLLDPVRSAFYGFFQANAVCYGDAAGTLQALQDNGIKTAALTDVAYGMDNAYALRDIRELQPYLDVVLTSVDVGYRKPHKAGFLKLMEQLDVSANEMLYVGDEKKDIAGAKTLGIGSVLICREKEPPDWGQTFTIAKLSEICTLV